MAANKTEVVITAGREAGDEGSVSPAQDTKNARVANRTMKKENTPFEVKKEKVKAARGDKSYEMTVTTY